VSEGNRRGRRGIPVVALLLVLLLAGVLSGLGAAGALPPAWFGTAQPERGALDVEPPDGLPSPQVRDAQPVLPAADGQPGPQSAVAKRVAPLLRDPSLRKHVGVAVADLASGEVSWDNMGADLASERFTPASTLKLFTTVAALAVLDPGQRFATTVVRTGGGSSSRLVLVGGGDPLLARGPDTAQGDVDSPARSAPLHVHGADPPP
jgi:D-alanyl-D-alanine carboxypeptidase/D-alanyl-D-alanine-endopeptidase (penicillin-binding protein 4)